MNAVALQPRKAEPIPSEFRREFMENGFVVIRSFFSKEDMNELLAEIQRVGNYRREFGDNGTGKVFFYHNLYRISPAIQSFCSQPKIVRVLNQLLGPSVWLHWDHAVEKGSGGESFPWHQDNAYSQLKDGGVQMWIAVSDSKTEQGGLVFQRGSHKKGLLPFRQVGNHRVCDEKIGEEIAFSCSAGDVAFFSSYTLHQSMPNRTADKRWVYVIEYMSQKHMNPAIPPPYFMISENGRPDPRMVRNFAARMNPVNRLKYFRHTRINRAMSRLVSTLSPAKNGPGSPTCAR